MPSQGLDNWFDKWFDKVDELQGQVEPQEGLKCHKK